MTGTLHDLGNFDVPGLKPGRRVRVYEPRGRFRKMPRPVLYLFDGQNVFGDEGSYAGGWYAQDAVDKLLPGTIFLAPLVVGIDHGGDTRIDELGPWKMSDKGGLTDLLLQWMTSALMPILSERFPIIGGPIGAVVGGSSMGGLAAMYAHWKRPDAFGGALCLSPSFWFAGGELLKFVRRGERPPISRVYVDCGLREGGGRMSALCEKLCQNLKARGYPPEQLLFRPDPRGAHNESSWRRRLPKALRFMFRR